MRVRLVPVGEIFRRDAVRRARPGAGVGHAGCGSSCAARRPRSTSSSIERMMDPVLHLVRNAVSHGLETAGGAPGRGQAARKGRSRSRAASVGETVVLEIADDGRGIDAAAVAARARALGFPLPDGPIDAATLLDVICAPGFSTRDETDRGSGRGVGMAVVKTTVEELNGTMTLQTAPGEGTRFVDRAAADPVDHRRADRARRRSDLRGAAGGGARSRRDRSRRGEADRGTRDRAVPRRQRCRSCGWRASSACRADRAARSTSLSSARGVDAVGIAVDRIVGQREIVVRGMADALIRVDGIPGRPTSATAGSC